LDSLSEHVLAQRLPTQKLPDLGFAQRIRTRSASQHNFADAQFIPNTVSPQTSVTISLNEISNQKMLLSMQHHS